MGMTLQHFQTILTSFRKLFCDLLNSSWRLIEDIRYVQFSVCMIGTVIVGKQEFIAKRGIGRDQNLISVNHYSCVTTRNSKNVVLVKNFCGR